MLTGDDCFAATRDDKWYKINPEDCRGGCAVAMWPIAKLLFPLAIITNRFIQVQSRSAVRACLFVFGFMFARLLLNKMTFDVDILA